MNETRKSALLHEQPYLAEFSYMTVSADGFPFTSPPNFSFSSTTSIRFSHHQGRSSLAYSLRFSLLETLI
jgi:hypothetical protein